MSARMKVVYSIAERNGRSYWTRVGAAFENQDGSLNVHLEAMPSALNELRALRKKGGKALREAVVRAYNEMAEEFGMEPIVLKKGKHGLS